MGQIYIYFQSLLSEHLNIYYDIVRPCIYYTVSPTYIVYVLLFNMSFNSVAFSNLYFPTCFILTHQWMATGSMTCACVCVCVCMYMCMYLCIYVCMHAHKYCLHTCTHHLRLPIPLASFPNLLCILYLPYGYATLSNHFHMFMVRFVFTHLSVTSPNLVDSWFSSDLELQTAVNLQLIS